MAYKFGLVCLIMWLYCPQLCGDEFCAPDGLKHHEVKQHKLEHFTCLACNLKFSNSEEKFKHYVSTHEEKKRCKPCSFYIQGEHHWRVHQALYHTPDLEWADCSPPFLNLSPPRINDGIAKKRSLQKSGEEIQLSPAKRRIVWHSDISEANCLPNNVRSKLVQAKHSVSDKLGMISPLSNSGLVDKLSKNNTQIIYKSKCDSRKSVPHSAVVISRVSLPNNSLLLSRVKGIQSAPQILDPSSNFQLLVPSQPPQVLTQVSAAKSPQVQSKKHIPVLKIVKRNTGTPQPPNSTPKYQIVSSPQGSKLIVGKPECLAGLKDISVSQKQVKLQQSTDIMVTPGKLPSLSSGLQSTKQHCDGIEVPGECRTKGKNNSVNKKKQGSVSRQNLNPKVVIAPLIVHPTTVKQTPRRPSILKSSLSKKQSKTVKNTVKLNSPRKSDVASSKAQETVSSSSTDKTQAPEQMEDTPVQSTAVSQTAVDKTINIDPQLSNSVESLIANWEVSLSNPKLCFTSTTSDVVDDCNNKIDEKSPDSSQQMDRSLIALKSKQLGQVSDDVERYENSVAMEPNTMDICETSAEIKLKSGDEASALNPTGESTTMINAMEVATDVTVEVASCSSATPTHMDQIDSTIKILLPQPMDSNGTNVSYSPMEETHSDPMSHCNGDATSPDIDITIQVSSTAEKCESEVTDFESEAVSLPKSMKMDSNLQNDVGSIDDELCHVMDFSEPTEQLLSKPKPDMPVRQTEYLEQFLKFQNQNPR
ncbi:hypothetical protein B566_EDAN008564 [Ephemera danica]|nr:hypothetical protein B566_EDAN008564 [Ephemera danica]